jgi:hypothetical protein
VHIFHGLITDPIIEVGAGALGANRRGTTFSTLTARARASELVSLYLACHYILLELLDSQTRFSRWIILCKTLAAAEVNLKTRLFESQIARRHRVIILYASQNLPLHLLSYACQRHVARLFEYVQSSTLAQLLHSSMQHVMDRIRNSTGGCKSAGKTGTIVQGDNEHCQ